MMLLILVILPFWTSFLLRTYAWIVILSGKGLPTWLAMIGIEGVRLINTPFAVLLGIVYGYLPLMVFPLYVTLGSFGLVGPNTQAAAMNVDPSRAGAISSITGAATFAMGTAV